jgi:hypothetical protein
MTDFTFTSEVPAILQDQLKPRLQGWIDAAEFPQFDLKLRGRVVSFVRNPWPAATPVFVSLRTRLDLRNLMQRRNIGGGSP